MPPLASKDANLYEEGMTSYPVSTFVTGGNASGNLRIGIEKTGTNTYKYVADFDFRDLENSTFRTGDIMDLPNIDPSLGNYVWLGSVSMSESLPDGGYAYKYVSYSAVNGKLRCYAGSYSSSGNNTLVISNFDKTRTVNLPDTLEGITAAETQANVQEVLDKLCYQYKYDTRNRLIEKKIPGKGWEYIVYDKLDRPVMTQDANLRATNEWLFTKYDVFGRVAYTGIRNIDISRSDLQTLANQDTYTQYESKTSIKTLAGTPIYYSSSAIPTAVTKVFTINYYDTYEDVPTDLIAPTTVLGQAVTLQTKSLPTVSKVRVLGTSSWITSVTYYDAKARPIYMYSKNPYLGTTDITKLQLDFTGKTLQTHTTHKKAGQTDIVTIENYDYDHAGRLLTQTQNINNQAQEMISNNHYDELGQLVQKDIGNTESNPLQEVDYSYNIRGWLKKINNNDWGYLGEDLFALELGYNDVGSRLYNGNISEMKWITANDNARRKYRFYYDDLNRLRNSYYNEWSKNSRFNVYLSYDMNGNILSLNRRGAIVENPDYGNNSHYGSYGQPCLCL